MKRAVICLVACVLMGANSAPVALAGEVMPVDERTVTVAQTDESPPEAGSESGEDAPQVEPEPPSPALLTATDEVVEDPPLVLPPILINRVSAGVTGDADHDYIELHNPNPDDVFLDSWQLVVKRKDGKDLQVFTLHGTVKAKSYILIAASKVASGQLVPDLKLSKNLVYVDGIVQLLNNTGQVIEHISWGTDTGFPALSTGKMINRNYTPEGVPYISGDLTKDFDYTEAIKAGPERAGGYIAYVAPVNRCAGLMISEIAANVAADKQFIELYNPTSLPIILDGCLLQTNRSTTKSYALSGTLQPGGYVSILVSTTGLTLTKTTTGTVYLLSSDGKEEMDARSYDGLAAETSWAWFGESDWRQTFSATPGQANVWQKFLPCDPGYERNLETGRCRKIVVESAPEDCGPGKYRSPETNRCRKVEAADVLTPCKSGQYRNPETGRCRSLASAASVPTPCKPDQERNPETNRCRKKPAAGIPESAFAVEPIKETGKAFAGWWVLGGLGTLAVGRGAWEWRSEMLAGIRKIASFFTSGK